MSQIYKAIIIDDEPLARGVIKKYLEEYPYIEVLRECENGFEGLKAIQESAPDLVFLDIQMPKLTGFEMLELLAAGSPAENPPVIIFVTAYEQYALKAFEASAADYLLKPFSPERFREALQRALLFVKDKPGFGHKMERLIRQHDDRPEYLERVVVKDGSKITVIPLEKLTRLEAQDDYVMLHTKEGKFLKQKTLKYFEAHLPPNDFIRIHRSHIVKFSVIRQIEAAGRDSYEVRLTNGESLPLSKSGYRRLKQMIEHG